MRSLAWTVGVALIVHALTRMNALSDVFYVWHDEIEARYAATPNGEITAETIDGHFEACDMYCRVLKRFGEETAMRKGFGSRFITGLLLCAVGFAAGGGKGGERKACSGRGERFAQITASAG